MALFRVTFWVNSVAQLRGEQRISRQYEAEIEADNEEEAQEFVYDDPMSYTDNEIDSEYGEPHHEINWDADEMDIELDQNEEVEVREITPPAPRCASAIPIL